MTTAGLKAHMRAAMKNICPADDELLEFYRGRLLPDRREEIGAHLPACAACRQILQDAADFLDADESSMPATVGVEQEFRALWNRIQSEPRPEMVRSFPQAGADRSHSSARRPLTRRLMTMAMAASVLIALGGVFWGLWSRQRLAEQHRSQVAELTNQLAALRVRLETAQLMIAPSANILLIELFSNASVRGNQELKPAQVENAADRELVFILNGQGIAVASSASYRIELRDRDGRLLWQNDGIGREETGNFMVSLPAGYLRPGSYVMSIRGGSTTADYTFNVKE